jgi:rRNA-processing protein FCF1
MSFESFVPLIHKYSRKGLLIDTNVLLLLLVGSLDRKLIGKSKITANQGFTTDDYEVLKTFIGNFQKVITTPHVLSEVSNHVDKFKGDYHREIFKSFACLIEESEEHFKAAQSLTNSEGFVTFGLTDVAISVLASEKILVLTSDFPLAGFLEKKGVDVINFNHLRQLRWY